MSDAEKPIVWHASCVEVDGIAAVLRGPSGSGKSTLALQLMAFGAQLVADDAVYLSLRHNHLFAHAPEQLPHAIEVRGLGLLPAQRIAEAPVGLIVDLSKTQTQRLPDPETLEILGHKVALVHKIEGPHFPSAILQYLKVIGQRLGHAAPTQPP